MHSKPCIPLHIRSMTPVCRLFQQFIMPIMPTAITFAEGERNLTETHTSLWLNSLGNGEFSHICRGRKVYDWMYF